MSAWCERPCSARSCECPPERTEPRLEPNEIDYVVAERLGLRMNDGATREELAPRAEREVPSWLDVRTSWTTTSAC